MTIENEDVLNRLLGITLKHGLKDLKKNLNELKLGNIPVRAAFLGEFNAGKTTIINAIIQRKLLPAFDLPTTSLITEISQAEIDQAFVIRYNADEEEIKIPISFAALADNITNTEYNKKVFIGLKNISLTIPNLLLIDTPGIASLNETHDDVTYGYLPLVDVAFVILNPNSGDLTKTLTDFLGRFPKDLSEKIYFVVSRADQLPKNALKDVVTKITATLSVLVDEPKVLIVSGKDAVDAIGTDGIVDVIKHEASGIETLKEILNTRLPYYLRSIEKKRLKTNLNVEAQKILTALEFKQASLDWSLDDLQNSISQHRSEIELIEKQIDDFQKSFRLLKIGASEKVRHIVKEYSLLITFRLSHDEQYDDLILSMTEEVKQAIDISMKNLRTISFNGLDDHTINIATILQTLVEKETSGIREISDIITNTATFALTLWIAPGSSAVINTGEAVAGTGVLLAQEADNVFNTPKGVGDSKKEFFRDFGRIAGTIGRMVKEINPLEKIKSAVLPKLLNPKLSAALSSKIESTLNNVFDLIGHELNQELQEKYLKPLKVKENLLEAVEKAKSEKRIATNITYKSLEMDINYLKTLQ